MSLSLTLFQLRHPSELSETQVCPHHELKVGYSDELFKQIEGMGRGETETAPLVVRTWPIPPGMKIGIYGEEGWSWVDDVPYINGDRLTYAMASDFKLLTLGDDAPYIQKAILAFISHLPDVTPIVLYWH